MHHKSPLAVPSSLTLLPKREKGNSSLPSPVPGSSPGEGSGVRVGGAGGVSREFSDAPARVRAGERQKRLASGRNGLNGVRHFHDTQYTP